MFYFILFLVLLLIGEIFSFRGIQFLLGKKATKRLLLVRIGYGLVTLFMYGAILWLYINQDSFRDVGKLNAAYVIGSLVFLLAMFKIIFGVIHALNDGVFGIRKGLEVNKPINNGRVISRSRFLSMAGLTIAALPFGIGLMGIVRGRFNFSVFKEKVSFAHLPAAFDGLKIIHISDLHIGSFPLGNKAVTQAIDTINELKPDLILFTGDLVNDTADEAQPWLTTLSKLQAKYGKFSVLGNHDYGDYINWETPAAKQANADAIKQLHADMGFELLLDQNKLIEKEGESIRLIGIENWGTGRFPKYGILENALKGTDEHEVQILLSHDPSHWDEQVLNKTKIDLALAGHTHGFQLGIEIPGVKWSPAKFRYPRWAGLYKENNQYLYVNRGFGYIGYAGRVGIPPEITEITLTKA